MSPLWRCVATQGSAGRSLLLIDELSVPAQGLTTVVRNVVSRNLVSPLPSGAV